MVALPRGRLLARAEEVPRLDRYDPALELRPPGDSVLGGDDATGRGTSVAAGKYITNDIYVEIITDAKGFTATQLEISLTKALSILSQTASSGGSSASLRYSKDY